MGKVIQLDRYKSLRRQAYLKRFESQLSKFIDYFLAQNLRFSFESLSYYFISAQQHAHDHAAAWDYVDFREALRDGFHEAYGKQLLKECRSLYWFDERFLSEEELVDRCVSKIILGPGVSAVR